MVDSRLQPRTVDDRLRVLEERVNNLDANYVASKKKISDMHADYDFRYSSLLGQIDMLNTQLAALTGEPIVAAAAATTKARRAMRPEAGEAVGKSIEECALHDAEPQRAEQTEMPALAHDVSDPSSPVPSPHASLAAGSTDVGYLDPTGLAIDSLRELLVTHMTETAQRFERLHEQRQGAAEGGHAFSSVFAPLTGSHHTIHRAEFL